MARDVEGKGRKNQQVVKALVAAKPINKKNPKKQTAGLEQQILAGVSVRKGAQDPKKAKQPAAKTPAGKTVTKTPEDKAAKNKTAPLAKQKPTQAKKSQLAIAGNNKPAIAGKNKPAIAGNKKPTMAESNTVHKKKDSGSDPKPGKAPATLTVAATKKSAPLAKQKPTQAKKSQPAIIGKNKPTMAESNTVHKKKDSGSDPKPGKSPAQPKKSPRPSPVQVRDAAEVRPFEVDEIKKILSRSGTTGKGRKIGARGSEAGQVATARENKSWKDRWWFKLAVIFGPSLVVLFVLMAVPGLREGVFGSKTVAQLPPPTNLLPSKHDAVYLSPTLLLSNQIVAYYGHPQARWMGIVGRYSKEELAPMLRRTAASYDSINGSLGTVPAFYLIWASVQPRGEIQFMNKKILESYIRFTATNGFLLILDHQIGKYGPLEAVRQLLPFLRYPHVHLAIDPEWRTLLPMKEIGHVTGEEINQAQILIKNYILSNRIPGKRMLIVHQFENKMFVRREAIQTRYDPVVFIHSVSGWGSPSMKLGTWLRHTQATNLPHKGFKLWYYPGVTRPGLHYDYPLMSHRDVIELKPSPRLIMYQ